MSVFTVSEKVQLGHAIIIFQTVSGPKLRQYARKAIEYFILELWYDMVNVLKLFIFFQASESSRTFGFYIDFERTSDRFPATIFKKFNHRKK